MCAIVKHGGNLAGSLAQRVVLHDDDGHACHSQVLLGSGIDGIVLGHVDGTREDVGRHVGNQAHGNVEILANLRTIDSVIGGDVQIVGILGHCPSLGNEGVVGVGRRGHFNYLAEELGFFHGLLGPYACVQVGSLLDEEVIGNHAELERSTATKEDD